MRARLPLLVALSISLPVFLAAQDVRELRSLRTGDLVRIAFPCQGDDQPLCPPSTWLFEGVTGDHVEVRHPGQPTAERVPLGLRTRIEVLDGTHGNAGTGVLLGLVAGVGAGVVLSSSCSKGEDRGTCQALTWVTSIPLGALFGAIIGANVRSDTWRTVTVPDHPTLDLQAGPRGVSVGLRFRF